MTCYVYIDYTLDGIPFYVGIGSLGRIKDPKRNKFHAAVAAKNPGWYRTAVLEAARSECKAEEIRLIALYGRRDLGEGTLVNLTGGGEGTLGAIRSDEYRAKQSAAHQGRVHSEESRNKMSAAWKLRTPMTDETRAKVSSAAKLRVQSEETKAKISAAKKNISDETRAKISSAAKLRVQSEETKAKISAAAKNISDETRAKMSTAAKLRVRLPHSEESRNKMSVAAKKRYE